MQQKQLTENHNRLPPWNGKYLISGGDSTFAGPTSPSVSEVVQNT